MAPRIRLGLNDATVGVDEPASAASTNPSLSVKPAAKYFADDYARDFTEHGNESLCGGPLQDMMRKAESGRFPGFAKYALCQFALNLHNQAFHAHFPHLHRSWLTYAAPFGDTRRCFSGHGLASQKPDAILWFIQQPPDASLTPIYFAEDELGDSIRFFFRDYLQMFADSAPISDFVPADYLAAVAADAECCASLLTPDGWIERNIALYLPT